MLALASCGAPTIADMPVDTASDDAVCAGFRTPCDALPPRPSTLTCAESVRAAIAAQQEIAWPANLSALQCFTSRIPLTAAPELVPYDVAAPLFSEGSDKGRFLLLPPQTTITPSADGAWGFPIGTVIVKVFGLPVRVVDASTDRPIEVRLMALTSTGWRFASYAWDEAARDHHHVGEKGEEATFTLADGPLVWSYPSQLGCVTCHRVRDNQVLGVQTAQLHHRYDYGDTRADQLVAMDAIGLFSPSIATLGALPAIVSPHSTDASNEDRARAWLHGNCAHCHQPEGFAPPELAMDLRYSTPFAQTATCGVRRQGGLTIAADDLIAPGDADNSALVQRVESTSFEKMPPDGAGRYDRSGIAAVRTWIDALDGCP